MLGLTEDPGGHGVLIGVGDGVLGALNHIQSLKELLLHAPLRVVAGGLELLRLGDQLVKQLARHVGLDGVEGLQQLVLRHNVIRRQEGFVPFVQCSVGALAERLKFLLCWFCVFQHLGRQQIHRTQARQFLELGRNDVGILRVLRDLLAEATQPVLPEGGLQDFLLAELRVLCILLRNSLFVRWPKIIEVTVEPYNLRALLTFDLPNFPLPKSNKSGRR
mmetsp:Transcript_108471/g.187427  ORF Transcript_108471/g.187427 Transcript_108471/m.187427 type:complete len:219 (-) Transcript_108471:102-758(-)